MADDRQLEQGSDPQTWDPPIRTLGELLADHVRQARRIAQLEAEQAGTAERIAECEAALRRASLDISEIGTARTRDQLRLVAAARRRIGGALG